MSGLKSVTEMCHDACAQGVGGTVQYPKNYLKEAFELVRERGGLCIADEVWFSFFLDLIALWNVNTRNIILTAVFVVAIVWSHVSSI